jgi:uncharacterized protein YjiS (DUF1127 family)
MTAFANIATATRNHPDTSLLGRIVAALHANRLREETAKTYRDLLKAEDHILNDLGVTRDDVRLLLDQLTAAR